MVKAGQLLEHPCQMAQVSRRGFRIGDLDNDGRVVVAICSYCRRDYHRLSANCRNCGAPLSDHHVREPEPTAAAAAAPAEMFAHWRGPAHRLHSMGTAEEEAQEHRRRVCRSWAWLSIMLLSRPQLQEGQSRRVDFHRAARQRRRHPA